MDNPKYIHLSRSFRGQLDNLKRINDVIMELGASIRGLEEALSGNGLTEAERIRMQNIFNGKKGEKRNRQREHYMAQSQLNRSASKNLVNLSLSEYEIFLLKKFLKYVLKIFYFWEGKLKETQKKRLSILIAPESHQCYDHILSRYLNCHHNLQCILHRLL